MKNLRQGIVMTQLGITQGYPTMDGWENADNIVTTDYIDGGKHYVIELNEGYTFTTYAMALYDANNNILSNHFVGLSNNSMNGQTNNYRQFSKIIPKGYSIRVTIRKSDSTNFTDVDCPIKQFYYVDEQYFSRATKTNQYWSYYRARAVKSAMLVVKPKRTTKSGGWQTYPSAFVGVMYSSALYTAGFVGIDVSYRTYLSAFNNAHSVAYTEVPYHVVENEVKHKSKYGFDYSGVTKTTAHHYYGSVCNTIPNLMRNTGRFLLTESNWKAASTLRTISSVSDMDIIEPLDYCITKNVNDHIFVVLDKLYDADGVLRFIEFAEQGGSNYANIGIAPTEIFFENRLNNSAKKMAIYKPTSFSNYLSTSELPIENTPFIASDYADDSYTELQTSDDICTFLGDYASMRIGDPVWLNIPQGTNASAPKWDKVKLYSVADGVRTLVDTRNVTSVYDEELGEYWTDINIADAFDAKNDAGEYECTAFNSSTNVESSATHFEMLWIQAKCIKTSQSADSLTYMTIGSHDVSENVTRGKFYWVDTSDGDRVSDNTTFVFANNIEVQSSGIIMPNRLDGALHMAYLGKYGNWVYVRRESSTGLANKLRYVTMSNARLSSGGGNLNNSSYRTTETYSSSAGTTKQGKYIDVTAGSWYTYIALRNASTPTADDYLRMAFYSMNDDGTYTLVSIENLTPTTISQIPTGRLHSYSFQAPQGATHLRLSMINADTYKALFSGVDAATEYSLSLTSNDTTE